MTMKSCGSNLYFKGKGLTGYQNNNRFSDGADGVPGSYGHGGGGYTTLRRLYGPSSGFRYSLPFWHSASLLSRYASLFSPAPVPHGEQGPAFFSVSAGRRMGFAALLDAALSLDIPIHFHGRGSCFFRHFLFRQVNQPFALKMCFQRPIPGPPRNPPGKSGLLQPPFCRWRGCIRR